MGKTLPDELVEVLDLVGVNWPNIDEDEVRSTAKDYRRLAEGIGDAIAQGNRACSFIVGGKSKGKTVQALDRRWGKLTTRDLATFSKALDDLADALDDCAGFIEGCKVACITELTATAAAATAGVIGMFFTVGLSGLLSAAAIAACRIALHEAIDYAIGQITQVVTDKIEAKILGKIEDLFTDALDAHDDDTAGGYVSGSADMATDLAVEFDDYEKASGGYDETKRDFDKKKTLHKTGGGQRRSSVKKDSRFHKLATVMDKAEDAVDKKADETVLVLEKHGADIDAAKKEHKKNDKKTKEDIDGCKDVRTYLLDADGTVRRLEADGDLKALDSTDKQRLDGILNDGKAYRPSTRSEREDLSVGDTHTQKVKSTKVDPYTDELGQATQLARYARNDYDGNNYAAGRYVDPDGRGESILVGYSQKSMHSERSIGYPLLHNGKQDGLKEVFTEREPCQKRPRCDAWLDKYFKEAETVHHTNTYNQDLNEVPRHKRDKEHQDYMDELKAHHGR
ncbi:nucleic acid/nucleotide deaminase domain-containing protein [Streptomyces sp. NPDC051098]|uniref:nucleic acid/nucleotide deaminase domain-containing protein n=1 Tax=Streptomyces sp. NPDC051098 TaxID=3155411 RepID=UPI00341309A2